MIEEDKSKSSCSDDNDEPMVKGSKMFESIVIGLSEAIADASDNKLPRNTVEDDTE